MKTISNKEDTAIEAMKVLCKILGFVLLMFFIGIILSGLYDGLSRPDQCSPTITSYTNQE